ncbi:acyl-CoA dehydratase activase [Candidatus Omnitrophota bacterium]
MIFAGLDIGAVSTEVVFIDEKKKILCYEIGRTGASSKKSTETCMNAVLKKMGKSFSDVTQLVATGYGRKVVPYDSEELSEISCHAIGAQFLFPETKMVIDIGGQDSKAIRLNNRGDAIDFNMNDKCAAGTGRFLEEMAKVLETTVENFGKLSMKSKESITISSMCTVFAESEVVSLLHEGKKREDIARALHNAIADRVLSLAYKVRLKGPITLTGGVAKNIGVLDSIKLKLPDLTINVPEEPQIVGALGAAVIAADKFIKQPST